MPGSFRLGKLAGFELFIHVSWLLIVVLLTWSLATGWFPALYQGWPLLAYWLVGLLATLLLFASVLAHELAHSLVARTRGLPVKSITLLIFGGISNIEQEPANPGVEFQMAFVGPLTSLLLGGLSYLLLLALRGGISPLSAILGYLAVTNVLLGIFNLVSAFPLDGGRVLRSIVWKISGDVRTATRVATFSGSQTGCGRGNGSRRGPANRPDLRRDRLADDTSLRKRANCRASSLAQVRPVPAKFAWSAGYETTCCLPAAWPACAVVVFLSS